MQPGFGAPLPGGFGAAVGECRDWLIGALEGVGEPVDLVGHDWGGAYVVNVSIGCATPRQSRGDDRRSDPLGMSVSVGWLSISP